MRRRRRKKKKGKKKVKCVYFEWIEIEEYRIIVEKMVYVLYVVVVFVCFFLISFFMFLRYE